MFSIYAILVSVGTLIMACIWLRLFFKDNSMYISFFPLFFNYVTLIASCIFIESGSYVWEMDKQGNFNYASLVLLLFWISSMPAFLLGMGKIRLFRDKSDSSLNVIKLIECNTQTINTIKNPQKQRPYIIFLLFCLVILYINLALSDFYWKNPLIDRYVFWKFCRFPLLNTIMGNTSMFIPIMIGLLIISYPDSGKRSLLLYVILIVYLAYLIAIGHKFGGILSTFYLISLSMIIASKTKISFSLIMRHIDKLILLGIFIIGITYIHYLYFSPLIKYMGMHNIFDAILYRALGLQGGTWWGTFNEVVYLKAKMPSWDLADLYHGMKTLMIFLSPYPVELLEQSLEQGKGWSSGYQGILIFVFPLWLSLFLNVIFMIILGIASRGCVILIRKMDIIMATLYIQLFLILGNFFSQGNLFQIVSPKFVLLTIAIIVLLFIQYVMEHTKKDADNGLPSVSFPTNNKPIK